jgi:hypothetical protein
MAESTEIIPHTDAPFIGVCGEEIDAISSLQEEIYLWYRRSQGDTDFPYRAITGRMREDRHILSFSRSIDSVNNIGNPIHQFVPHNHPKGTVLHCVEARGTGTTVCEHYSKNRMYSSDELSFDLLKAIQSQAREACRTFTQQWTVEEDGGEVIVSFLVLFPGTFHYRELSDQKEIETPSQLHNWLLDAEGRFH